MNADIERLPAHLYVHVPFCDGACAYCGFYSVVADAAERAAYAPLPGRELRRLLADSRAAGVAGPCTLYVGGGTPNVLGAEGLAALARGLGPAAAAGGAEEWTVELSPAGVTPALAQALRRLGANRASLGAQVFDDAVLRAMGRRHAAADVPAAFGALRGAGFDNLGLDLIAGLPGMTAPAWDATLARAVALAPEHVSVYALSIEPDTELAARQASGAVRLPDDEAQLAALAAAEERLTAAGYVRYEISNYCRPGRECRHNLAVWRGEDYLGLGPSAASRVGRRRWTNRPDAAAYRARVTEGQAPERVVEALDPAADAAERFLFGLRLAEGVSPAAFARRWPAAAGRAAEWERALARLERQGALHRPAAGVWRLTPRGREVADAVMRELA
jgi:oxygen-independent coproporphyrinogen-3 oxidase